MKKIFFVIAILIATMFSQPANADEVIPAIISIAPASGTTDGGTSVTINGAAFTGSTVIKVDGVVAAVTFVNSNTITLAMPAHAAGFVNFSASNGIVAAISSNIYEYVTPTPAPAPAPAPTPPPVPVPAPAPSPITTLAPEPTSSPTIVIEQQQQDVVSEEILLEEEILVDEVVEVLDLSNNAYLMYEDGIENLVIESIYSIPNQFILKERVKGKWITISKSYQFNNRVVYLDTKMNLGSTYKVVVKIDGLTTIVSWFKVLSVIAV